MKVRVKKGLSHGARRQYRAGDELDVSAATYAAFKDKFEVVEEQPKLDAPDDSSLIDSTEFNARSTFDASSMKISEVLRYVESGLIPVAIAIESERSGRNRKTLLTKLEAME